MKDKCVICKRKGFERCIGGDRYKKEYLREFKIDFESIYQDSWKDHYFVCWDCLGKHKKYKQKEFLVLLEDLREEYLENGSPTWWQSGIIEGIDFIIKGTKDIIKAPNALDSTYEAWLNGVFEVMDKIKEKRRLSRYY